MDLEKIEAILGRELMAEEKSRLEKTKTILGIDDQDAVWDIITIFEYYGDLCKKAPREIDASISKFSDKLSNMKLNHLQSEREMTVFSLQNLSVVFPLIIAILLTYGAAAMWAGYYLGLGRPPQMFALLLMPVGYVIALSAFCPGVILMLQSAYDLAGGIEKKRGGIKAACAAICFFVASSILALTANYS